MKARIKFRKYGAMKYIGHLDVMRFFQKAMRRAGIPIAFTGGYSPHMIMSFAQPLGVGITSDGEYLDIELTRPIASGQAADQLNSVMVPGVDIVSFVEISGDRKNSGMTIVAAADYAVTFPDSFDHSGVTKKIPEAWIDKAETFLAQDQIIVLKKTKRSEKEADIRPMIFDMKAGEDSFYLFLATGSEQNLKPDLVMQAFFQYMELDMADFPVHYHRLDVYARGDGDLFLPLDSLGI